jgi:hypothetical protein
MEQILFVGMGRVDLHQAEVCLLAIGERMMNIIIPTNREVLEAVREVPAAESLLRKLYPDAFINYNGGDAMGEDLVVIVTLRGGLVSAVYVNNEDVPVRVITVDYDDPYDDNLVVVVQDELCVIEENVLLQDEDFVSAVMEVL